MDYYDDNQLDLHRAQLEATQAQTKAINDSAIGIMFFLACLFAPAAVTTGLWWLAGLAFVGVILWAVFALIRNIVRSVPEDIRSLRSEFRRAWRNRSANQRNGGWILKYGAWFLDCFVVVGSVGNVWAGNTGGAAVFVVLYGFFRALIFLTTWGDTKSTAP